MQGRSRVPPGRGGPGLPRLPAGVPDRRRHPDHADRRGKAGLTAADLARLVDPARRAAAAANHAFIGTEHLLAAALTEGDGAAPRALSAAGEIGRASCRGSVLISEAPVSLKK